MSSSKPTQPPEQTTNEKVAANFSALLESLRPETTAEFSKDSTKLAEKTFWRAREDRGVGLVGGPIGRAEIRGLWWTVVGKLGQAGHIGKNIVVDTEGEPSKPRNIKNAERGGAYQAALHRYPEGWRS